MTHLPWTVHLESGECVAACRYCEDAALMVAACGDGAMVRYAGATVPVRSGGLVVWTEGAEAMPAGESYDSAAETMRRRRHSLECGQV